MKSRPPLPRGPWLVVGLARSGEAAALALAARGETVIGVDAGSAASSAELDERAGRLRDAGVEVRLDDSGEAFLRRSPRVRALVKSPGVPANALAIAAARAGGIPILGELELGWRLLPNRFLAVTGTNGKTTTTEWIGHIHREAGLPVVVAGNIGTALTSLAGAVDSDATIVCEASSFQLEDASDFAPETAVILNLAPDHLDRHGTFEAYRAAKLRIFAHQGNDDIAVAPEDLGIEDLGGCARPVTFGTSPEADLAERAGALWWARDDEPLLAAREIALPGDHNRLNAMAAAAACLANGVERGAVVAGLRSFPGVRHRLERVAVLGGVAFVNDSKATNVASTLVALEASEGAVHLILGGVGKGQDFSPLAGTVAARCRSVHLIGRDAQPIAAALGEAGVPLHDDGDLEHALEGARAQARAGETVLLSPACASFDQYPDFEARGEHFRELVMAIGEAG